MWPLLWKTLFREKHVSSLEPEICRQIVYLRLIGDARFKQHSFSFLKFFVVQRASVVHSSDALCSAFSTPRSPGFSVLDHVSHWTYTVCFSQNICLGPTAVDAWVARGFSVLPRQADLFAVNTRMGDCLATRQLVHRPLSGRRFFPKTLVFLHFIKRCKNIRGSVEYGRQYRHGFSEVSQYRRRMWYSVAKSGTAPLQVM